MSSEIIPNVAYNNYDDFFEHINFLFSQNFISLYFEDYLMTKLGPY
jgi:hypothetical protein